MTGLELAVEFTDLWRDLESCEINQMLAKNISYELLEFFSSYGRDFAAESLDPQHVTEELCERLPNLLIIGYIIRILEERVR
jgi:hypothetical protein